ncbi:MAG: bifunctional UDP-N-acetylmuramoyl-tripeptide:D-alanyl-D-alanine ligase/alanine racemase [Bacteroidota bacterium]
MASLALATDLFQGEFHPRKFRYVAYDSRLISHGAETLFVALKTGNRDGHDFVEDAYQKGVRNFMVNKRLDLAAINYALVDDTLEALQRWAMNHRRQFSFPIWAITGSNGKTTVKEWLATLLEMEVQLVKSPMSYNSQLGAALSLLQLHPQADLAVIEAGISQAGEMAVLAEMIQPTHGILTHMGAAHAENFDSFNHKLQEKLLLFQDVNLLVHSSHQEHVSSQLEGMPTQAVGQLENDHWKVTVKEKGEGATQLLWSENGENHELNIPFTGDSDIDNASIAIASSRAIGMSMAAIKERLPLLRPVLMRTEIISDNPDITLINDSYNSDVDSVRNAFQQLGQLDIHPQKWVILSDVPHLGDQQVPIQQDLLKEAEQLVGKGHVITIGPVFGQMGRVNHYNRVEDLLDQIVLKEFEDSTILLKGARNFALEKLIPRFNTKLNATTFRIDLGALSHNFRYLKSLVPEGTKSMCMVKASSYGSGTWEIAQHLEKEGATYFAVAYASEGIELRQAGISLPIMVMNPDLSSVEALLRFDIEPEVSNFPLLKAYLQAGRLSDRREYRIHLKLDTGMGRLGFLEEDLPELLSMLGQSPDLNIISVMSHLAAADMQEEDEFTLQQFEQFDRMYAYLQQELGIQSFRHILNTSGILRFPQRSMDMVRMGIGLYGINPVAEPHDLREIGSLISTITQIHTYPAGTSIGYGRSQKTRRASKIGIVPVGYADSIPRRVGGGKMSLMIRGQRAPIFGRVCMDMLMVDVTDIAGIAAGEEVLIFGSKGEDMVSINEWAEAAETIAYELLVRISPRVRKIYTRE